MLEMVSYLITHIGKLVTANITLTHYEPPACTNYIHTDSRLARVYGYNCPKLAVCQLRHIYIHTKNPNVSYYIRWVRNGDIFMFHILGIKQHETHCRISTGYPQPLYMCRYVSICVVMLSLSITQLSDS